MGFEVRFADPPHPLFLLYPEYDPMSVIGGRVSIEPPAASGAGYVSACSSNHQLCVSAKTGRKCRDDKRAESSGEWLTSYIEERFSQATPRYISR